MRPTPRAVGLFGLGIAVALLPAIVDGRLWRLWVVWAGLVPLGLGLDFLLAVPRRRLHVQVRVPDVLFIGARDALVATLDARGRALSLELCCDLDPLFVPQPVRRVAVPAGARVEVDVALVPRRRGTLRVGAVWARWDGPLGLARRQARFEVGRDVAVVPDVRSVRRAALQFFSRRDFLAGLKVERYIGDGTEFESLREYVPGLDHRAMNWKASGRHRTLLCTNFRAERNHQVVLALDAGHLMREPLEGVPKLDRAINAALHLAYVCLRTGDRVGFFAFDEQVRTFVEPAAGTRAFRALQRLTAGVRYSTGETNFTLGLAELALRLRRRSLVVLLTDFVDTVTAELMTDHLARLSRRHLVLFVTLRDPALVRTAEARPGSLRDVYHAVVASNFVQERELVLRRLRRIGVHCIDEAPDRVTTDLLNHYLELKRREAF